MRRRRSSTGISPAWTSSGSSSCSTPRGTHCGPLRGRSGPAALGTLLAGLLEDIGLPVRADAFTTVLGWLGGADATAEVRARLAGAAAAVEAAKEAGEHADVQAVSASIQPLHRDLLSAVRSHPEDSLLRRRLEPALVRSAPADLFGPHVDNRARYLASLDQALAALQEAAGSGRSELNAVARGLNEALRPLQAVPDKIKAFFARFGIDIAGRDLREITTGIFDLLEPSRLLAPLTAAFVALRSKLSALVRDGLLAPVRQAIADLQGCSPCSTSRSSPPSSRRFTTTC